MPKLALIFPRFRYPSGDFPIGIALLAAFVERELNWECQICDTTFAPSMKTISDFLEEFQPDVVGVGMSTLMLGEGVAELCLSKTTKLFCFCWGTSSNNKALCYDGKSCH